jgi:hypothetical protein
MAAKKKAAKKQSKKQASTTLTIQDVKDLGRALLHVGDKYPLQFVTETDFYPLVEAYLYGRVPAIKEEFEVEGGWIDFKVTTTTNPAYLELAVAPRQLIDRGVEDTTATDAPQKPKTALYGSANKTELAKLSDIPQSQTKGRFVLLLDLWGKPHDIDKLAATYATQQPALTGNEIINVVYVGRGQAPRLIKVSKGYGNKTKMG